MSVSQRRRQIVARLHRRKTRERDGLVLVEGIRAVSEAIQARTAIRFAVASPRLEELGGGRALRDALEAAGVEVEDVDDRDLAGLAGTERPQGVMLVCVEPHVAGDVVRPGGRYLVLDAVQDPGNVGTLVRTAVGFALDAVLALDGTADPWSPKAVRASAGLVFRRPVVSVSGDFAMSALGAAGVPLFVADAGGGVVAGAPPSGGWALAVGNEGSGVREALRAGASQTVRVPTPGPAESLNAATAGAILLYALSRSPSDAV